jgi:hypothetical protein
VSSLHRSTNGVRISGFSAGDFARIRQAIWLQSGNLLLNRNRRLAKDFEKSIATAVAWTMIASVIITR